MIAYALRPFRYSDDGITVRQIAAGTVFNCRPDLFAGLERGGLVRPAGDKMDRAPIEIGEPVALDTSAVPAQPGQDGDGEAEGGEGSGDASSAADEAPTGYDPASLVAKHRGRGSYSVMDGEREVVQGLDKGLAERFNALDPASKAAFVAERKPAEG